MLDMHSRETANLIRKAAMQWVVMGMIYLETAARLIALGVDVEDLEMKLATGEAV